MTHIKLSPPTIIIGLNRATLKVEIIVDSDQQASLPPVSFRTSKEQFEKSVECKRSIELRKSVKKRFVVDRNMVSEFLRIAQYFRDERKRIHEVFDTVAQPSWLHKDLCHNLKSSFQWWHIRTDRRLRRTLIAELRKAQRQIKLVITLHHQLQ